MALQWVLALALTASPPVPEIYRNEVVKPLSGWTMEQAALGKRLFNEKELSRDRSISCASCHDPALAFTDGRRVGQGIHGQSGARNTPTVINRGLGDRQFWDGRAASLAEQALGPMANPVEMGLPVDEAVKRLAANPAYRRQFKEVFGKKPTAQLMGQAIAAYEATVYSVDAPYDQFLAGKQDALSPSAHRGLVLFEKKARCAECHAGPNLTDELFHTLGVGGAEDHGRAAISKLPKDEGAFKTPTLREIARTAPYMHDGSLKTLADVVDYYARGGESHANLDPKIQKIELTAQDKADLVAFLGALSGHIVELGPAQIAKGIP